MSAAGPRSACAADLARLFELQRLYLEQFFQDVEYGSLRNFCQEVADCDGTVYFSGVGKSGFIAQKVSATLVSGGVKSAWLDPSDALRGDIGVVHADDLLVLFSKSGSSEELLRLVPYARAKGARIMGVSSNKQGALAKVADTHVLLPLERELCPFDLAPVTSTAIQMIFGDTCAVAVMRARNLTRAQFSVNHPAGREGKRLLLGVRDVMIGHHAGDGDGGGARHTEGGVRTGEGVIADGRKNTKRTVPTCGPHEKLVDALVSLSRGGFGCVLVVDSGNGTLLGTFTDGDLRRRLGDEGGGCLRRTMREVMTTNPRITCVDAKAADSLRAMTPAGGKSVSFLPVVSDAVGKKLLGIVTLNGLVKAGL